MAAKVEIDPKTGFPNLAPIEAAAVAALSPADSGIEEFTLDIPLPSGFTSHVLITRPKPSSSSTSEEEATKLKLPLIVLFHGGGFITGSPRLLIPPARSYAAHCNAVVASCSYPLMPTHAFPASISAGWAVLCALAQRAKTLGADLDAGFVVGGVSAGATIATVCVERAVFGWGEEDQEWGGVDTKEKLVGKITGLWTGCPVLFVSKNLPDRFRAEWTSREEHANAPGLNLAAIRAIERLMALDNTHANGGLYSGTNVLGKAEESVVEKLGYPPVYINVGRLDPLRDDGLVFEKILKEKGVKTMVQVNEDDPHISWTVMPLPTKSKNPTIQETSLEGMKWLLNL
jgi:acetyl esterase/lipase